MLSPEDKKIAVGSRAQKGARVKPAAPESFFEQFADLPRLTLQLLWNRGITEAAEIETFLAPDYERHTHDPFLFRDMRQAAERITKAASSAEKITVFGDYDADGVCGAAIMHEFFNKAGVLHDVYIPDRSRESFGLSIRKIKDFHEAGTKLLITIDCGVTDYDEIELANSLGIDVIILDHHLVPPKWPRAFAIIDHKREEETYPEKVLSGAGLAFKLTQALIRSEKFQVAPGWEKWLLDLAAIAAIADMVPLSGENRVLVSYGLKVLRKAKRIGLRQLFAAKVRNPADADTETISHFIAPRINAASRMEHASLAFDLLTTKSEEEAGWLARRLEEKNEERKKVMETVIEEVKDSLQKNGVPGVIFSGSSEWPAGVLGLAASRLVEAYDRPVFLYAMNDELVKGSCRAPKGMNVVELMTGAGGLFSDFGGHTLSGGFSILPENIVPLKEKLEGAGAGLNAGAGPVGIEAEAELSLDDAGEVTFELVKALEPFGQGNPRPLFLIRNVKIADIRRVGADGSHLKMKLGPRYIGAIYFRAPLEALGENKTSASNGLPLTGRAGENGFKIGDTIDVMAELSENVWNGSRNIELRLIDAHHSQENSHGN